MKHEQTEWGEPLRYLTDDRDMADRHELVIFQGGNGDWYVSVLPEGHRGGPSVRLCTSGGASRAVPGLTLAIAAAYRALHGEPTPDTLDPVVERGALEWMRRTAESLGVGGPEDGPFMLARALTSWIDAKRAIPAGGDHPAAGGKQGPLDLLSATELDSLVQFGENHLHQDECDTGVPPAMLQRLAAIGAISRLGHTGFYDLTEFGRACLLEHNLRLVQAPGESG